MKTAGLDIEFHLDVTDYHNETFAKFPKIP